MVLPSCGPPRAPSGGILAPPWLPYRHGLDFVTDLAAAATTQAQDVAERRIGARLHTGDALDGVLPPDQQIDELGVKRIQLVPQPVEAVRTANVFLLGFHVGTLYGCPVSPLDDARGDLSEKGGFGGS